MLCLKATCLNATTEQPYIKSLVGGKQKSKEEGKVSAPHNFHVLMTLIPFPSVLLRCREC